jgi:hypothetical protein
VPLSRGLHPEFGYVGSPRLCRKLGLVLAFIVFGLVAGANGITVFMADADLDPMNAMALAPAKALNSATTSPPTPTVETETLEAGLAQKTSMAGGIKSPCRKNITEQLGSDCSSGKAPKARSVLAINERPAIAAVPIGNRDGPTVLASEQEIPVAATPDIADGSVKPADASKSAPASIVKESPAPAASTKLRTRSNSAQRHDRDDSNSVQRRDRAAGSSIQRRDRPTSNSVQRRDREEYSAKWRYSKQYGQSGYAWPTPMVRRSWVW